MEPLDLRVRPPRGCYEKLDGLMLLPRTIDKIRALMPGGNPGCYFINGRVPGLSGYLLSCVNIAESDFAAIVAAASTDQDVASRLRERVDASLYPQINATLRQIQPEHSGDLTYFKSLYGETMEMHPDLRCVLDIIDADDNRMFPER